MRFFLQFISEPRISILAGFGFVSFHELVQDGYWEIGLPIAAVCMLLTFMARPKPK
jgi:hypothetical protein